MTTPTPEEAEALVARLDAWATEIEHHIAHADEEADGWYCTMPPEVGEAWKRESADLRLAVAALTASSSQPVGGEGLRLKLLEMLLSAVWSPASGPVEWTDEKIGRAEEQAGYLADSIISLFPSPSPRLAEGVGWRPIDEAPRDGTPIDIWVKGFPDRRVVNMKWDEHEWGFRNVQDPEQGWMEDEEPTHWQPLPEPPTQEEGHG